MSRLYVGQLVEFGRYPQDRANDRDGPIIWLVVRVDERDRTLLLSVRGLDVTPYATRNSWIRAFLGHAFTSCERNGILRASYLPFYELKSMAQEDLRCEPSDRCSSRVSHIDEGSAAWWIKPPCHRSYIGFVEADCTPALIQGGTETFHAFSRISFVARPCVWVRPFEAEKGGAR